MTKKTIGTALALLCLCVAPALAGQWVLERGDVGFAHTASYKSDKLLPGEHVLFFHNGTQRACDGKDSIYCNEFLLVVVFDLEGKKVKDFTGITLRAGEKGEDQQTLYRTSLAQMGGRALANARQDWACSPGKDPSETWNCRFDCFRTQADAMGGTQGKPVACTSADAGWVVIRVRARIWDDLISYSKVSARHMVEKTARSDKMIVQLSRDNGGDVIFVPLDDTFRKAFWDPVRADEEWKQAQSEEKARMNELMRITPEEAAEGRAVLERWKNGKW